MGIIKNQPWHDLLWTGTTTEMNSEGNWCQEWHSQVMAWPAGQWWSRDRAPLVKGCEEGAAHKQVPWQSNKSAQTVQE